MIEDGVEFLPPYKTKTARQSIDAAFEISFQRRRGDSSGETTNLNAVLGFTQDVGKI